MKTKVMQKDKRNPISQKQVITSKDKLEQDKENRLNTLSNQAIQEAFAFQKEKAGWDFYSEREFVENLFNQRFNYLIVIYSLFITAAASVKTQINLIIVLSLGIVMTTLVSMTIYRAYVKMIIVLRILYTLENHVFQIIDKEVKSMGKRGFIGVNQISGIIIPLIIFVTLLAGLICAIFGLLQP